jgi:hypothetical protein
VFQELFTLLESLFAQDPKPLSPARLDQAPSPDQTCC